jgi:hypothetical protein
VKLILKFADDAPPTAAALELAIKMIAERAGLTVPAEATVVIEDAAAIGAYPLSQAVSMNGDVCWFASYQKLLDEIIARTAAELKAAGLDEGEETLERQTYILLRRKLLHWPPEKVQELVDIIIPLLNDIVHDLTHHHHEEE